MNKETLLYTPSLAGSGQFAKCAHCKKNPIKEMGMKFMMDALEN